MNTKENNYELIKFEDGDFSLDVRISFENNTAFLTQKEMSLLFNVSVDSISLHIKNILNNNELNSSVVEESSVTATDGKVYKTKLYNLDMIVAVGMRTKSSRINKFEKWVKDILSQYKTSNNNQISQLIRFSHNNIVLDVNVSPKEDTVWLNKDQLSLLYETTRQNIEYHIANIYEQNELEKSLTCKEILHFTTESERYEYRTITIYNLDMIISLGYRINSRNGIIFRRWATKILKEYLLTGSVVNAERCLACTSNILELKNKVEEIENKYIKLENTVYTTDKMVYEGELVEPLTLLRKLFFLAKNRIVIIDDYVDNTALILLKNIKTKTFIITSSNTYLNKEKDIPENICIIKENKEHDRAIFIDDYVYMFGTSFNAIGKERFTIIKVNHLPQEVFLRGINLDKYDTND